MSFANELKLLKADAGDAGTVRVPVVLSHLKSQPIKYAIIPAREALILAEELIAAARRSM